MPTRQARPVYDRWREHGALPSRLHQQGQVVGRGYNWLYLSFGCDDQLISLRLHLIRVLDKAPDGC
ncbi:MAG: hypothetical protein ACRDUV_09505 [Pseudonocardiaceae bacterium]